MTVCSVKACIHCKEPIVPDLAPNGHSSSGGNRQQYRTRLTTESLTSIPNIQPGTFGRRHVNSLNQLESPTDKWKRPISNPKLILISERLIEKRIIEMKVPFLLLLAMAGLLLSFAPVNCSKCTPEMQGKCTCEKTIYEGKLQFLVNCTYSGFTDTAPLVNLPPETEVNSMRFCSWPPSRQVTEKRLKVAMARHHLRAMCLLAFWWCHIPLQEVY